MAKPLHFKKSTKNSQAFRMNNEEIRAKKGKQRSTLTY